MSYEFQGKSGAFEVDARWWHPMWLHVEKIAPRIACLVAKPFGSDGTGLDGDAARDLGAVLREYLGALSPMTVPFLLRLRRLQDAACNAGLPRVLTRGVSAGARDEARDVLLSFAAFCEQSDGFIIT